MSEGKTTTFQDLRNAAIRAKRKVEEIKAQGEEIAGEFIATVGVSAGSASIGFLDELKGEVVENGIRMHKIGTLPTGLVAGFMLEGAAALGAFGKYARVGYAIGQGGVSGYTNTVGRLAGARMREKTAKVAAPVEEKTVAKKTGTAG